MACVPGSIEYEYNRTYICVNPNAALGPPTFRISNPDEISNGGGGGSGGAKYDFDGKPPIVVDTIPGVGSNPNIVKTSMDIQLLDDRTT